MSINSINPVNNELLKSYEVATNEERAAAMDKAHAAFKRM